MTKRKIFKIKLKYVNKIYKFIKTVRFVFLKATHDLTDDRTQIKIVLSMEVFSNTLSTVITNYYQPNKSLNDK